MVEIEMKKWVDKKLLIFSAIASTLLIANIASFIFTELDQFNVFYKYQEAYSLEDWNLPHNVEVDIDGDGKKDKATFDRCIYLSSINPKTIPQSRECDTELYEEKKRTKVKGNQLPQTSIVLINSYLGRKDNSWNIVVNTLTGTKLYEITSEGNILEKEAPLSLKIDSFLYTLSHLIAVVVGMSKNSGY